MIFSRFCVIFRADFDGGLEDSPFLNENKSSRDFDHPLSYPHRGVLHQREGGDPKRFNGNPLAAMDGTGLMGNAIVLLLLLLLLLWMLLLLFPRRAGLPSPGRI